MQMPLVYTHRAAMETQKGQNKYCEDRWMLTRLVLLLRLFAEVGSTARGSNWNVWQLFWCDCGFSQLTGMLGDMWQGVPYWINYRLPKGQRTACDVCTEWRYSNESRPCAVSSVRSRPSIIGFFPSFLAPNLSLHPWTHHSRAVKLVVMRTVNWHFAVTHTHTHT